MFNNLNAEMARKKITIKELSRKTNIKYESLKNKMAGNTEFKRSEMLAIKSEFPGCTMDYLFSTEEVWNMLRRWKVPALVQHRKSDKDCFQKVLKMRQNLDMFGFETERRANGYWWKDT